MICPYISRPWFNPPPRAPVSRPLAPPVAGYMPRYSPLPPWPTMPRKLGRASRGPFSLPLSPRIVPRAPSTVPPRPCPLGPWSVVRVPVAAVRGPWSVVRAPVAVCPAPRSRRMPPGPRPGGGVPPPIPAAHVPWAASLAARAGRQSRKGFSPISDKYLPTKSELVSGH